MFFHSEYIHEYLYIIVNIKIHSVLHLEALQGPGYKLCDSNVASGSSNFLHEWQSHNLINQSLSASLSVALFHKGSAPSTFGEGPVEHGVGNGASESDEDSDKQRRVQVLYRSVASPRSRSVDGHVESPRQMFFVVIVFINAGTEALLTYWVVQKSRGNIPGADVMIEIRTKGRKGNANLRASTGGSLNAKKARVDAGAEKAKTDGTKTRATMRQGCLGWTTKSAQAMAMTMR